MQPLAPQARVARRALTLRYATVATGPSIRDVVMTAGGYLYDHALAGWDVVVVGTDTAHRHALSVLGATLIDLRSVLAREPLNGVSPSSMAPAMLSDPGVVRAARGSTAGPLGDVKIFRPAARYSRPTSSQQLFRRSSMAGRAFKREALRAANIAVTVVEPIEVLTVTSLTIA